MGGAFPRNLLSLLLFGGITFGLLSSMLFPLRRGLCISDRSERFRVLGIFLFMAAMAVLVLGIAWGRASDQAREWGVPAVRALECAWVVRSVFRLDP